MGPIDPSMLAALGGTGALGIAQGIASAVADQGYQKRNKEQLNALLAREKAGTLGLTGQQRGILDQSLNAPVAAAAAQARSRAEQIQASSGDGSGADLSRLRVEQGRTQAAGAQQAALQIAQADDAAQQMQKSEIEQREALKGSLRRDDYNSIFSGLQQAAAAGGQLAGVPKGMAGAGSESPAMGLSSLMTQRYSPDELSTIQGFARDNPQDFIAMLFGGS